MSGQSVEKDRPADAREILRAMYDQRPSLGCPTEGCKGDPNYAPPGRGHLPTCDYLRVLPSAEGATS